MGNRHESRPKGVVSATEKMAVELAALLSPEHAKEIRETSGMQPKAAVLLSLAYSVEAYAFAPNGRTVFLMGVEAASPITGSAMPWMLGTMETAKNPAGVLRTAKWGLERAFRVTGATRLEQYIPEWYRTGLRFASRIGFDLRPAGVATSAGAALWHAVCRAPERGAFTERKTWEQSTISSTPPI